MIIVSGSIHVADSDRGPCLEACLPVIAAARAAEGCRDFHLAPDPLETGRINGYEAWEGADMPRRSVAPGHPDALASMIRAASVHRYEVVASADPLIVCQRRPPSAEGAEPPPVQAPQATDATIRPRS